MTTFEIPSLPMSLIPSKITPPPKKEFPVPIETIVSDTENKDIVVEPSVEKEPDSADADPDSLVVVVDDASPPNAETLNNTLSLKQLRDRCTELGLNAAGKKMELAERIVTH